MTLEQDYLTFRSIRTMPENNAQKCDTKVIQQGYIIGLQIPCIWLKNSLTYNRILNDKVGLHVGEFS